jgi:hypothetical protein
LSQKSLPGSSGSYQEDVGFLNFDVGAAASDLDPFVMLVDGYRETLFRFILSDHILVEKILDLTRLRKWRAGRYGLRLLIVGDDLIADVDAFIANVNSRTRN